MTVRGGCWEGVVLDVYAVEFTVCMTELSSAAEYGEIGWKYVSDADLPLVQPGSLFRWTPEEGVVFRRECWTAEQIEEGRAAAKELGVFD